MDFAIPDDLEASLALIRDIVEQKVYPLESAL